MVPEKILIRIQAKICMILPIFPLNRRKAPKFDKMAENPPKNIYIEFNASLCMCSRFVETKNINMFLKTTLHVYLQWEWTEHDCFSCTH